MQTTLKWLILVALSTLLYVGRVCMGGCPMPQYLPLLLHGAPYTCFYEFCWIASKSLASFLLSTPLCASTLCTQVAFSMFSRGFTSINISTVMLLSFCLPIYCCISNLSESLYSHSVTFVHSLPIILWAVLLLFLCSFWYCNASMIWLQHSLNQLFSTWKHFLFWFAFYFFFLGKCPWVKYPPYLANSL